MTPAARYKAVFELMSAVFADKEPADNTINAYFRARRYIGSGDRRFIGDKIWDIIRRRRRLEFDAGSKDPRKMLLCYLQNDNPEEIFTGGEYALPPVSAEEKQWLQSRPERPYPPAVECECPDWLFAKIKDETLLKALNRPAPADFRVNKGNREEIISRLAAEGYDAVPAPWSPVGIRLPERINLNNCTLWQEGLIEVQDEASQLAALMCDVSPRDRVIDYCCGAGGKSLAIASLLKGKGMIEAHDINPKRLEQLKPRMERLGIANIKTVAKTGDTPVYTRFIIDAPCSGTGTWRRSPDAKFRLTEERLNELNAVQDELLEKAYTLTVSGGRIIYMTCSVLADENDARVQKFLARHPDIKMADMPVLWHQKTGCPWPCGEKCRLELNPVASGTDGFFIAVMEKR